MAPFLYPCLCSWRYMQIVVISEGTLTVGESCLVLFTLVRIAVSRAISVSHLRNCVEVMKREFLGWLCFVLALPEEPHTVLLAHQSVNNIQDQYQEDVNENIEKWEGNETVHFVACRLWYSWCSIKSTKLCVDDCDAIFLLSYFMFLYVWKCPVGFVFVTPKFIIWSDM